MTITAANLKVGMIIKSEGSTLKIERIENKQYKNGNSYFEVFGLKSSYSVTVRYGLKKVVTKIPAQENFRLNELKPTSKIEVLN